MSDRDQRLGLLNAELLIWLRRGFLARRKIQTQTMSKAASEVARIRAAILAEGPEPQQENRNA